MKQSSNLWSLHKGGFARAGLNAQRMPYKIIRSTANNGSRFALISMSSRVGKAGGRHMNQNVILLGLHRGFLARTGLVAKRTHQLACSLVGFAWPRSRTTNNAAAIGRRLHSKNSSHRPRKHGTVPSGLQVSSSKVGPHGAKFPGVQDVPQWLGSCFAHPCT